jgi:outer membrane protein assembly factor BamB
MLAGGLMGGLLGADLSTDDAWPQWRGPLRTGVIGGTSWPDGVDESRLKPLWSVELGPSYSGPIVVGERVFVTETRNQSTEHVQALNRRDGQRFWEAQWDGSVSVPFFAKANGDWIRATPACDGETVYVAGIRDVVVALDVATGQERWRTDLVAQYGSPVPTFGFVSSPLIVGDALYVQAGGGFVRLDKRTGKVLWRALDDGGGMNGSAFSSPYLATLNGVDQLLVQTREKLAGVEPTTGKVLWSTKVDAFRGMNILTPVVDGNRIFTSSYGGGTFLFAVEQPNSEAPATVSQVWRNKVQGYMSTPVVIDGHAYLHLRNQRFTCVELATGLEKWTTTPFGKYWSLVAQGNKILGLDETGMLRLIRATPEKFDLLSERQLTDNSWAHLAVAGDDVYVRHLTGLTAYRWK